MGPHTFNATVHRTLRRLFVRRLTYYEIHALMRSRENENEDEESRGLLSFEASGKQIEERWVLLRIPSTGLRHITGISSSYSSQYPVVLQGVVSQQEFTEIIDRLNEAIRDYWPCDTCYYFGYGCSLCTIGLSVLVPHYCATHSEKYATAMLRNVSLKAKFYDRRISFQLVKNWCHSYVEMRVPAQFFNADLLAQHANDTNMQIVTSMGVSFDDMDDQHPVRGRIDLHERGISPTPDQGSGARPPQATQSLSSALSIDEEKCETSRKKAL